MRKKIIIATLLVILVFVVAGCSTMAPATTIAPISPLSTNPTDTDTEARLINQPWISPAEVKIGNYFPGAQAEWAIRIHNGNDDQTTFKVSYRIPNRTRDGYSMPPDNAQDWVIIADTSPVFVAKETKDILITLVTPKEALIQGNFEFWISVIEQGQGNIQTEMASRWLVSMR